MRRSIIPAGFEASSHRIFRDYSNPLCLPVLFNGRDENPNDDNISKMEGNSNYITMETPSCCPICLQSADNPVTLVACHHFFCIECIIKWFQKRLECPLCKVSCAYFIQPSSSIEGHFNLWKTAPTGSGNNEIHSSLNLSSKITLGLRRAMTAHKLNFESADIQCISVGLKSTSDSLIPDMKSVESEAVPVTKASTVNMETVIKDSLSAVRMVNHQKVFPSSDVPVEGGVKVPSCSVLSGDLKVVCEELRKLEEELKAEYDSDYG